MDSNDNDLIARLRREKIEPDRPIKPAPLAQIRSTRRRGIGVRLAVTAAAAATLAVIAGTVVLVQQNDNDPTPAAPSPSPTSTNEPGTDEPGPTAGQNRPCVTDQPEAGAGETVVKVYFICQKTTLPVAAYRVVGGAPDQQVRAVLEAYFAGLTKKEHRAGLIAPIGRSLADVRSEITIDGSTVEMSFADLGSLQAMEPTQRDFFIDSLAKTVRDLDGIRSLELALNGDCAQFWSTAAGSKCMPIS
ncbi:hypothetical protein [Solicola gregarius]|uniref:GerMN domain-containing protein n=1 Tax=Solicola gregarius TaxID=2908642 RepID=A0AA46YLE0_9ACTN|nr:hypothetical protein [Solicola gregarius]UYM06522.1 hypothetical protein L0C25_05465 [Solicola gregarius]